MNWRVESVNHKISNEDSCRDPDLTALQVRLIPEERWILNDWKGDTTSRFSVLMLRLAM